MDNAEIMLAHFKRLYVSCRTHYIISRPGQGYYVPKRGGTFVHQTDNALLKHLHRDYAIGIYAGEEGSKFICFDVDDGSSETVSMVVDELVLLGIPRDMIYISFSGRKGFHIEVFFDAEVETEKLQNLYQYVIMNKHLDPKKVEFRPTQKMAIKLPLSRHSETGNICWYVDQETLEPIEDMLYITSIQQVHVEDVDRILSLPALESLAGKANVSQVHSRTSSATTEGIPGTMLTAVGTRHESMVSIAVYQRSIGATREENQIALEEWYAQQPPELIHSTPDEVKKDMEKILNWAYSDNFVSSRARTRNVTSVCESHMSLVLDQWSRSSRRIIFLQLVRARMGVQRISAADISKATGINITTVYEVINKLIAFGTISRKKGRRTQLPDATFTAESSSYSVPCKAGWPHEVKIDISMRELISDFDRTYHRALYILVRQDKIKESLTADEWHEFVGWAQVFESDGNVLPTDRRIDLLGEAHELILPIQSTKKITAYRIKDKWLFPAYDIALVLRFSAPSVIGSQCPHKEMWRIQVNRRKLPNGMMSHQVLGKNFIPMVDALDLVARSSVPEKEAIAKYLMDLEASETYVDEKGVSVS